CAVNRSGSQHAPLFSANLSPLLVATIACAGSIVATPSILYPPRLFCYPKALPLYNVQMLFAHHIFTSRLLPQRPTSQEYQGTTSRVQPRFDTDSH
ncbi:unnamed protein product, partial [Ectocarpus sp. 8 AP-2014]